MFHAWAVNTAKMEAASRPSSEPGKRLMKKMMVTLRKPSTGTDWRMSSAGMRTRRARRLWAAAYA